ncbi:discoidin domain-containing protein [Geothrix sp. 21YS21S-4]|uniref:discoidin domain-containing protein n=1 Tax=Geothrix sp. 21YS21S-4 TaxID=3068889 RepID=UPI0027B98A10|nr:discoidin domain-containing protein [Geothrix sp. 21YS21S-4]
MLPEKPARKRAAYGLPPSVQSILATAADVQQMVSQGINPDGSLKPEAMRALLKLRGVNLRALAETHAYSDAYFHQVLNRECRDVAVEDIIDAARSGWVTYGTGVPAWIQYEFPTAKVIRSYSIVPWSNDTYIERWLSAWKLEGSNDGSTWTLLDTRTHPLKAWVPFLPRLFRTLNMAAFTRYRLTITANGGNPYVGLQHLAFYEE